MIPLLTRYGPVSLIIVFVLNIVLKLKYILKGVKPIALWNPEQNWLIRIPFFNAPLAVHDELWRWVSVMLIYLAGLMITYFLRNLKFIGRNDFSPLLSTVLISSLHPLFVVFSEYILIAFPLIWSVYLSLSMLKAKSGRAALFNIGLILGFITDIKVGLYLFLILSIVNLAIIKKLDLYDFLAVVIGFLTPIYFAMSAQYLLNHSHFIKTLRFDINFPRLIVNSGQFFVMSATFLGLVILANFQSSKSVMLKSNHLKKSWSVFNLSILGLFVVAFLSSSLPSTAFVLPALLGSFVTFTCFNNSFKPLWNNILLVFIILIVILNQYFF